MRYVLAFVFVIIGVTRVDVIQRTEAADPKAFDLPLWESGAPGALGSEPKDVPMALVRLPASDAPTGALVICPGGGYGTLAIDHEGHQIAAWANEMGLAAIICDYRHRGKGYGHPAPSDDANRAIRLTRAKAKQWNIDPNRVGIIGFSAGGHLVSTILTQGEVATSDLEKTKADDSSAVKAENADPISKQSSRPDFGILCYPVIMFGTSETHKGSEKNLLGPSPDPKLVESFANHLRVTPNTPPTFVMHTSEDRVVPVANAIAFYGAMMQNKVPGELHIYEYGRHGIGLGHNIPGAFDWPEACKRWLRSRKIIQ
jgi:acetyl esterase/lipase